MPLYAPASRSRIVAQSNTAVSHTGDTNETALATITIPAGLMGATGTLRITTLWSHTNNANNKTLRTRLGGISGTAFSALVLTTTLTSHLVTIIRNVSAASQKSNPGVTTTIYGSSTSAMITGTINTANAQDLVLSGQCANGADTITLESYIVELIL